MNLITEFFSLPDRAGRVEACEALKNGSMIQKDLLNTLLDQGIKITQPELSIAMRELEFFKLVVGSRIGTRVYYKLNQQYYEWYTRIISYKTPTEIKKELWRGQEV